MKKAILFVMIIAGILTAQDKTDFTPKFSGYVRAWHQTDFSLNQGQFLIRQARLGIQGGVNEYMAYRSLVDFTRLGKLNSKTTNIDTQKVVTDVSATFSDILLDAVAIFTPIKNLALTAGQFKTPFGTDKLKSDVYAEFVNSALITNVSPASRDIGFMVGYKYGGTFPIELYAGAFNGSGINKAENDKTTDFVIRTVLSPIKIFNLSANYYKGENLGNELNYLNFGFNYKIGQLFFDGEFGGKTSESNLAEIKSNSFFFFSTYSVPVEMSFIKEITPAIRYDMYDPNTNIANDEIGRVTVGLSFDFAKLSYARFRINYEKYDYKNGSNYPDKLIFEIQTRF